MTASPRPPPSRPAVVLVSHGSRDSAAAVTTEQIRAALATQHGDDATVVIAYLDFDEPRLPDALIDLGASGYHQVRVVPLLFTAGHHVQHDVTTGVAAALLQDAALRVSVAPPLGAIDDDDIAGRLLLDALDERLSEVPRGGQIDGLVLLAAGSSDADARAMVDAIARRWGDRHGVPAIAAFASGPGDTVASAARRLRADHRYSLLAGALFVAPGLLFDRARTEAHSEDMSGAEPLGATPAFLQLLAHRVSTIAQPPAGLPLSRAVASPTS